MEQQEEKLSSVFSREHDILKQAEALLKQGEVTEESMLEQYMILLIEYKKLLRHTKTLTRVSDNQQRKLNRILERLGRYVSMQLFKKITQGKEKVEIKTQRKKLTVFFSDLKDFSYTSYHMEGEDLSNFLNSYLEKMTQIITKWGGTLDKYIGDAIMVFFGDPEFTSDQDHALRCVHMGIEMREKMRELRRDWYQMGYQEPLHCRMGIATGYCTVGNFGSSERMDYTIIGTPVNLASRLETAADVDEIYISHETWSYVKHKIACEPPVTLNLKGFHHPILAHKVLYVKDETQMGEDVFVLKDEIEGVDIRIDLTTASRDELVSVIKMQKKMQYKATHDELTGLLNQGSIIERLETEVSRSQREGTPLSLVIVDIDHLKRTNDTYGWEAGNEILQEVSRRLRTSVRDYDILGRYLEGKIMLVAPGVDKVAAESFAERIRKDISANPVAIREKNLSVTVSIGAATANSAISSDLLITNATNCLHLAKQKGRNRVELY